MANKDGSILKKNRILGHRRKKNLCPRCGKDLNHTDECIESYEKADNRIINPGIRVPVSSNTHEELMVLNGVGVEQQLIDMMAKEITKDIAAIEDAHLMASLQPPEKITLQRDFVILDLNQSREGNIIEFSGIQKISQRYKDFIVCIFGNIDSHFNLSDIMKIKKLTNIHEVKYIDSRTKKNYLHGCQQYLSFPNDYSEYCKVHNIPHFEFEENENFTRMKKLP